MSSIEAKVSSVRSWLAAQHILVDEDWLTGCVEYLYSDGNTNEQEIMNLAREQWLLNDLKDVCPGCLPASLSSVNKTTLTGKYVLQVNCALDVGTAAYQQYQKLKKVNLENIEETTRHEDKISNHRMIKLFLTDGVQEVAAIEYRTMRNLSCDITPGCKLLIKGPVDCRRGVLLLQEGNVATLGGEVEDLVAANSLPAVLNKILGLRDAGVADDNRAFQPAATISDPSDQPIENLQNINQNRTDVQRNTQNTDVISLGRTIPASERNSFDRNTSKETTLPCHRPVAVVTGVPVIDTFDDDIDIDQIAAIEEQVTKQNNKRPLWTDNDERRNSVEKKPKTCQTRDNEFPEEEDIFDNIDDVQDIFDSKPNYPINVPSEPFVYIKQIKEMSDVDLEGKVFKIKAQILKLLSKLTIGKDGWSLKCTLIDGTGCLDVEFTSEVLTKLVSYSPSQMNRMKKEMATNPEVKDTAIAALNAAKTNLQLLNCIIEVTFVGIARITELITFTERHAKLLQDRLAAVNM